jgi:hypothetical protein
MILNILRNWFRSNKIHDESKISLLESTEHIASGVFFTNGTHVLAGYQPKKQTPRITGIGGMKTGNESLHYTAIRECLEELFNTDLLPSKIVTNIVKNIKPKDVYMNGGYGIVVYTFTNLEEILKIVNKFKLSSNIYPKLPTTIRQLLFERKYATTSEVKSLCLIPLELYSIKHYILHRELITDIKTFLERRNYTD